MNRTRKIPLCLTPEQQALVTSHMNLAYWFLHHGPRRWRTLIPDDERMSEALFALTRAAGYHDPAQGGFHSLAAMAIRRHLDHIAYRRSQCFAVAFTDATGQRPELDDVTLDPPCHRTPRPESSVEDADLFERVRSHLSPGAFELLQEKYIEELTNEEIAQRHGVTPDCIRLRLLDIHDRLHARFAHLMQRRPGERPPRLRRKRRQFFTRRPDYWNRLGDVADALKRGATYRDIAVLIGCSLGQVGKMATRVKAEAG